MIHFFNTNHLYSNYYSTSISKSMEFGRNIQLFLARFLYNILAFSEKSLCREFRQISKLIVKIARFARKKFWETLNFEKL